MNGVSTSIQLSFSARRLDAVPSIDDVINCLPPSGFTLWIGSDMAIFGVGQAHAISVGGADAGVSASRAWLSLAHNARNDGDIAQAGPCSLPVAMGSFGFAADTQGLLVVPSSGIILRLDDGRAIEAWSLTQKARSQQGRDCVEGGGAPDGIDDEDAWRRLVDGGAYTAEPGRPATDAMPIADAMRAADASPVADAMRAADAMPAVRDDRASARCWRRSADNAAREEWMGAVGDVIGRMKRGEAQKVVMARALRMESDSPIDLRRTARNLAKRYPTCWTYVVDGLVGASPEMLCHVEGGWLHSLVLAGTALPDEGEELMASAKNREEHRLAVQSAVQALRGVCTEMEVPDQPQLLVLPNVCHLATHIYGRVEGGSLETAWRLHPTAAVGGVPTDAALRIISQCEGMDRGRYAAPVGWIDGRGDGQWAIALRCGRVDPANPKVIDIIAGGGIMPDSDPAEEYRETERKMRPMMQALGIEAT